jgi:hypothetical protein
MRGQGYPSWQSGLFPHPGAVEYIEHRDLPENLALTTESYIQFLETTVAELKKLVAQPFSVAGSITSKLSDENLDIPGAGGAGGGGGIQNRRDAGLKEVQRLYNTNRRTSRTFHIPEDLTNTPLWNARVAQSVTTHLPRRVVAEDRKCLRLPCERCIRMGA